MDTVNVQFEDEQRKTIIAVFSAIQDTNFWGSQGVVSKDDQRYIDFQVRTALGTEAGPPTSTPVLKRAFSFLR